MSIASFAARQVYSLVRLEFGQSWLLCLLALVCLLLPSASAQTPVLTQHNNNARTGAYTTETVLTPANVNQATFGKLFSYPADGRIYAQPLYVPNVSITGKGTHNVIFIATEHDSVYAFDADSNGGSNSTPLWQITLLDSAHGAASGAVLNFDPKWQLNRAGLLLQNGVLYVAFGSHGDNGPWHGWVLSYNAATLSQISAYCSTPNGLGSGVWMSGTGLAADVIDSVNKPYGRLFIPTGNGSFNATPPYTNSMNYGDDLIRLDLSGGTLTVQDSFTPFNQDVLNSAD